jgi:transcriptional regulator with XRE-family HTH domain
MNLCNELAAARRENGLSQEGLACALSVPRGAIARLEGGTGSVELLSRVMAHLNVRFKNIAHGGSLVEQLVHARRRKNITEAALAEMAGLDRRTLKSIEGGRGSVASLSVVLSVLAPEAARQEVSGSHWTYHRRKDAERDCRFTPPHILDALIRAFGPVALDPCSHAHAPLVAERKIMLPDDGLTADWSTSGFVYVNPPFSNLRPWLAKGLDAYESGAIGKLVLMLPAGRVDMRDFADRASSYATTLFLKRRFTFVSSNPKYRYPVPFAIALMCAGCTVEEIERFVEIIPAMIMPPQRRPYGSRE